MTLPWRLKRWNGSSWVDADLKRWNGSSWVVADMYFWDGAQWVLCTDRTPPTSTFNEQYQNIWSQTYQGNNNVGQTNGNRYQGYFDGVWGIQKTMYGFDYATIDAALSPRVATYSCQVWLDNTHTWSGSGGTAVIGTHTATSQPGTFSHNRYNNPGSFFFGKDEFKWVNVTLDMASWFANQSARGLTLYADSTDTASYYSYWTQTSWVFFSYEK